MRLLCLMLTAILFSPSVVSAQTNDENVPAWSRSNPRANRAMRAPVWGNNAGRNNVQAQQPAEAATDNKKTEPAAQKDMQNNKITQETPTVKNNNAASWGNPLRPNLEKNKIPPLTVELVESISRNRGNALTWKDFDKWPYDEYETDKGYISRRYKLDKGHVLIIGGPNLDFEPRFIYITEGGILVTKSIRGYIE